MPRFTTSDFDYDLPPERIAQHPLAERDTSRLLVLCRADGSITHRRFYDLPTLLRPGDVLVMNDSRVIPARLYGRKAATGAKVEVLLLRRVESGLWEALVKPGKRLPAGTAIALSAEGVQTAAEIREVLPDGVSLVAIADEAVLPRLGHVPLPPYIHAPLANAARYQTVYAREDGSAAAPTAGLHFTPELLARLQAQGVELCYVTLHIGLDTFRPVTVEDPTLHHIHREYGTVTPEVAARVSKARAGGRRVIAVGTTAVRMLEHAARHSAPGTLAPFTGWVDTFILPGHEFRLVDAMLTNFHLPRSTLLMLVSAFAGAELIKRAYAVAIREGYRFYSFGDAMLIL